jgi:hypothetical protein
MQISPKSAYQESASLSLPSLQRAIARRVPSEPSGRSSKRTSSVMVELLSSGALIAAFLSVPAWKRSVAASETS